jgi:BirA family biotin operon repressor/biotin-[acetyl-CoA-carboxylase] ligase
MTLTSHPEAPRLPPVYSLRETPRADPMAAAIAAARAGDEEGALFWDSDCRDLRMALLLHPDAPLADSLDLLIVASVGVGDALAALTPPQLPVAFGWPNRILLNGGAVAHLTIAAADAPADAVPDWMVLSVKVDMAANWEDDAPGARAHVTNLAEEGADDIGQVELLEAISRHLLSWVARWQSEEGLTPALASWRARSVDQQEPLDPTRLRLLGVLT